MEQCFFPISTGSSALFSSNPYKGVEMWKYAKKRLQF